MKRYWFCSALLTTVLGCGACNEADFPATDEPPPSALPDPGDPGSCASEQTRLGWVDGWRFCYPESSPDLVASYHFVMNPYYTRNGCSIANDVGPATLAFMSKATTNSQAGDWNFESYWMGLVTKMICHNPKR